jgi:hypothetical protein
MHAIITPVNYSSLGRSLVDAVSEGASGIAYETALPGGMIKADCRVPWRRNLPHGNIIGSALAIYNGSENVWWGRIGDATDAIVSGAPSLNLTAYGPWAAAQKMPFTQVYPAGVGWTTVQVIKAALYGNCPDVDMIATDWGSLTANSLNAISFSNANAQSVIAECLRYGGSTVAQWGFVIHPPLWRPPAFATDVTGVTWTNAGASSTYYMRPTSSYLMSAPGGGKGYGEHDIGSDKDEVVMASWFFIPPEVGVPSDSYEMLGVKNNAGNPVVEVGTRGSAGGGAGELYVYNYHTSTRTLATGNCVFGQGCWHFLCMYVKRHATTGIVKVWLDDGLVVDLSAQDTGDTPLRYPVWGMNQNGVNARTLYCQGLLGKWAATQITLEDSAVDTTVRCRTELFPYDVTTYDFVVSQNDIGDYTVQETDSTMSNSLYVQYTGARTARAANTTSIDTYGLAPSVIEASRLTDATVAANFRDRYLATYATPQRKMAPITLTVPPQGRSGNPYPLASIRAGLRFRIRELPELGNVYVGHTRYQAAESGQPETLQLTPNEPPLTGLDFAVAQRTQRAWT